MTPHFPNPIGATWLLQHLQLTIVQPLPVQSYISGSRATQTDSQTHYRIEFYQEKQRPDNTIVAHLQFHLRHEIVHFELLTRLFERIEPQIIQNWVNHEPTGQYARRAAFLYEFFTQNELLAPKNLKGNYVNAIDDTYLVAASPDCQQKNTKWRVNHNLAGNRHFCPMIIKNPAVKQASELDIAQLLRDLNDDLGEDMMLRSAKWFTLGESKSSFKIEGEENELSRIQRFAKVIEELTGKMPLPLDLAALQQAILGDNSVIEHFGIRQSPVFVGHTRHFQNIVDYIAPPADTVADKLNGVDEFWQKTAGQSPIMRTAVVAFAFVYIHPLADGNGRIHRFLFNDLLRREGITQEPIILPISGVIESNARERMAYADILEEISKPLMHYLVDFYAFSNHETRYPDGILSNLQFTHSHLAEPVWQYLNLSRHIVYFADVIQKTIQSMQTESRYLMNYDAAVLAIKQIVEMPNHYVERVIRSVVDNHGQLSNKLAKEFPILTQRDNWQRIVTAVENSFSGSLKD